MRDYDSVIKTLQLCTSEDVHSCDDCEYNERDCTEILSRAADAIEELLVKVGLWHRRYQLEHELVEKLRPAVPKWISVEERLPDYFDHVLCVNKFGIQMVGHLTDYKEGGFRCESGMDSCDYITHWMPLPEAPKEVQDG